MQLRIGSIILALLGEALFAFFFFGLVPPYALPDDVRILDFIVTSIVYCLILFNFLRPWVKKGGNADGSDKEVAGLGIRWTATGWYSVLALTLVFGNLFYAWGNMMPGMAFKWQALIQALLFILFLWGIFASQASQAHAKEVYHNEQVQKQGKKEVKEALNHLAYSADSTPGLSSETKRRIRDIAAEARYLTPSKSAEALACDARILDMATVLEISFTDIELNETQINNLVRQLDVEVKQRKKAF